MMEYLNLGFGSLNKTEKVGKEFYKKFKKSGASYYEKDLVKVWIKTTEVLDVIFKMELSEKCKYCNDCCCSSCKGNKNYFSSFDYFIYKLRGLELPKNINQLGETGCKLDRDKRSFTCLFYTCNNMPSVRLLNSFWKIVLSDLNDWVLNDMRHFRLYVLVDLLEEVEKKYNLIEINNKLNKGVNTEK